MKNGTNPGSGIACNNQIATPSFPSGYTPILYSNIPERALMPMALSMFRQDRSAAATNH
jgi:hypothetical protein